LFYLKTYPTLQVLGLQFGVSDTCANDNLSYLMPFKGNFERQASFEKIFEGIRRYFYSWDRGCKRRNLSKG
jgi:hypothetical protein